MFRAILAGLFAAALAPAAAAQEQDPAEVKKRILEKVREKLAADRAEILKRVEKIIDEELSKEEAPKPAPAPPAAPKAGPPLPADTEKKIKDLEKKLRAMEEQKEAVAAEIAKLRRQAEDEAVKKEAVKEVPTEPAELKDYFDSGIDLIKENKYAESIRLFKKIHYRFPGSRISAVSAYNAACGYALAGKKEEALDWLEISVAAGYNEPEDFEHLRKDTDLDGLRNEKRYKKLLTDR